MAATNLDESHGGFVMVYSKVGLSIRLHFHHQATIISSVTPFSFLKTAGSVNASTIFNSTSNLQHILINSIVYTLAEDSRLCPRIHGLKLFLMFNKFRITSVITMVVAYTCIFCGEKVEEPARRKHLNENNKHEQVELMLKAFKEEQELEGKDLTSLKDTAKCKLCDKRLGKKDKPTANEVTAHLREGQHTNELQRK